jgi:ATP-dependent Clp protease ATP-binding subunit ClpB
MSQFKTEDMAMLGLSAATLALTAWRLYHQPEKRFESSPTVLKTLDAGDLDPVIGRDDEIDRVVCILCRRTKNCAALVGAAGVGKTAIVEGLTQRIAAGTVPDALAGARVAELDLGAMVAGTRWRGMFEERLKDAIKKVEDSAGKLILFIDEMHMMVGTGDRNGTADAVGIRCVLQLYSKLFEIISYSEYLIMEIYMYSCMELLYIFIMKLVLVGIYLSVKSLRKPVD